MNLNANMLELQQTYIICTTWRSSSTLLCKLLASTNLAGNPGEFLLKQAEQTKRLSGEPYPDFIQRQLKDHATANGVSGVKLMWDNLENLLNRLGYKPTLPSSSSFSSIYLIFPRVKFIFLSRRDKLRQAISLARAQRSQVWHIELGKSGKPPARFSRVSNFHIESSLRLIQEAEKSWKNFFNHHHIYPYSVTYEDLCANPLEAIEGILNFLEIDAPQKLAIAPPPLQKLADWYSEALVLQYQTYRLLKQLLPASVFSTIDRLKPQLKKYLTSISIHRSS